MKTTTVARGFIGAVASLLGVVAVGCSAGGWEEGAAGEGAEIGSVEQAVTINTAPATFTGTARIRAASCVIRDTFSSPQRDLLVVAGGYESDGDAISEVKVYDPEANNWTVTVSGSLSVARGDLKAVQMPGAPGKCLVAGGAASENGAASTAADIIEVTAARTVSVSSTDSLNGARAKFQLAQCENNIIAVGGESSLTAVGTIEVFDASASEWRQNNDTTDGTSWVLPSLATARYDFAMAKDQTNVADRYILAGGNSAAADLLDTAEALVSASVGSETCKSITRTALTGKNLPDATAGLVAFHEFDTSNKFLFAGGFETDGTDSVLNTITEYVVDWGTLSSTTVGAWTDTLDAAVRFPMFAVKPAFSGATPQFQTVLLGGENITPNTFTTDGVQEIEGSVVDSPNLSEGRVHGVMEYLSTHDVYIAATGRSLPGSFLTSVVSVSP